MSGTSSNAQTAARQSSAARQSAHSELSPACTLSNATWDHFTQHVWEKEPAVYENSVSAPLLDAAGLLQTMQTAARAGDFASSNVWIEQEKIVDPSGFLPLSTDSSLEQYLQRIDQKVAGRHFTVLLANPHLHNEMLWFRARQFLSGLYTRVGIPCGGVDTGIFLGRYSKTPFGVHRGQMSVITFPILGTKRFLLWGRGYGEENRDIQDSLKYDRHLAAAIEKVAGNGDVAYWPADYWHIADGPVGYSAAINIGLWWDRPPLQRLLFGLSEALAGHLSDYDPRCECISLSPTGAAVPVELTAALDLVQRVIAEGDPSRLLQVAWMAFQSGGGFRDLPPACPIAVARPGSRVACDSPESILATETKKEIVVAANGLLHTMPSTPANRMSIVELRAEREVELPAEGGDQQSFLAFLLRAQAVRVMDRSEALGNRT